MRVRYVIIILGLLLTANGYGQDAPRFSRAEIVADYNRSIIDTEVSQTELAWTGNEANCLAGNISRVALDHTLTRINYFRRLVGVEDDITFDPMYNQHCQEASLMMLANSQLSHTPDSTWLCFTEEGALAASKSNISFGSNCSAAVNRYIADEGPSNGAVGHRRWILFSRAEKFGFGSSSNTSAMWVIGAQKAQIEPITFHSYPSPGYFVKDLAYNRWSFSVPGADFSQASIQMISENNTAIPVTLEPLAFGRGDNTIVWLPDNAQIESNSTGNDFFVKVQVQNVLIDGTPESFEYDILLVDDTYSPPSLTQSETVGANEVTLNAFQDFVKVCWSTGEENVNTITNARKGDHQVSLLDDLGQETVLEFTIINEIESGVVMECRERDSLALVALYNSTEGGDWINKWDLDKPMNEWYGVRLTQEGCVGDLFLRENNLSGSLPNEIGDLVELRDCELNNNNLSGEIPSSIGNLVKVHSLRLQHNSLNGSLPESIGNLTGLSQLILNNNNLEGVLPNTLENLEGLSSMHIWSNQFTGNIPDVFRNMTRFNSLGLMNNKLSGEIPASLYESSSINTVGLSQNNLVGELPTIWSNRDSIEVMWLNDNNFSGCIPDQYILFCDLNNNESFDCARFDSDEVDCNMYFQLQNNLQLPWQGNINNLCVDEDQVGAPCDDRDPNTSNDVIYEDCACRGEQRIHNCGFLVHHAILDGQGDCSSPSEFTIEYWFIDSDINAVYDYKIIRGQTIIEEGEIQSHQSIRSQVPVSDTSYVIEVSSDLCQQLSEPIKFDCDAIDLCSSITINNDGELPSCLNDFIGFWQVTISDIDSPTEDKLIDYFVVEYGPNSIDTVRGQINNGDSLRIEIEASRGYMFGVIDNILNCRDNTNPLVVSPSEGDDTGSSCDDGDSNTSNDVIGEDCECRGELENVMSCRQRDSLALVALYNSTDGPNWVNNWDTNWSGTWDLTQPIDTWYGIRLNSNGCVDEIRLSQSGLKGEIPAPIGELIDLKSLFLLGAPLSDDNFQELNGSIPAEIGNLSNLEELVLSQNSLIGAIPNSFSNLVNLETLRLGSNKLTGSIPEYIGTFGNLKELSLNDNQLSGEIPEGVLQLNQLEGLNLRSNLLKNENRLDFSRLINLESLVLNFNEFSGSLPIGLSLIQDLTFLRLENNKFTGCFPDEYSSLCYLTSDAVWSAVNTCDSLLGCQYDFRNNPGLAWGGDFERFCSGEQQMGAPCDDGDPNTSNDVIDDDCACRGEVENEVPCRSMDSLVLVDLYNATNGASWINQWDLASPIDTWWGIELTEEGCVRFIDMTYDGASGNPLNTAGNGNGLDGVIPPTLSDLGSLESVDFSDNNLMGCIPNSLMDICTIQLSLRNNTAMAWGGDFERFCSGEQQMGAPCDDGNANTSNDVINENCECQGEDISTSGIRLYVPNAFVADVSGPNFGFVASGNNILVVESTIFNSSGEEIYSSATAASPDGKFLIWNGVDGTEECDSHNTFSYQIVVTEAPGGSISIEGDVCRIKTNQYCNCSIDIEDLQWPSQASFGVFDRDVGEEETLIESCNNNVADSCSDFIQTSFFTPDGDGVNETLRFTNEDFIVDSEIYIYNRWGAEIYHTLNYRNDWDAKGYPDGVYYYVLVVDGQQIKSSVTVSR